MTKVLQILFFIFIFPFNSCSKEKEKTTNDNKPVVIYNDKYSLDINKSYKIFKVTFSSHESANNFNMEYIYLTDSILQIKTNTYPPSTLLTTYYLNNHVQADSCKSCSYYNPQLSYVTKYYFSYDSNGYLISSTAKNCNSNSDNTPFTTTYDYINGNQAKTTFDPKKLTILGKYISYSYNSYQNLINLDTFTGPWLGVLNKNLVQTMYIGGSMSDFPPCSHYQYTLSSGGLVEKTTRTPCNSQSNYIIITIFEYKIIDK